MENGGSKKSNVRRWMNDMFVHISCVCQQISHVSRRPQQINALKSLSAYFYCITNYLGLTYLGKTSLIKLCYIKCPISKCLMNISFKFWRVTKYNYIDAQVCECKSSYLVIYARKVCYIGKRWSWGQNVGTDRSIDSFFTHLVHMILINCRAYETEKESRTKKEPSEKTDIVALKLE